MLVISTVGLSTSVAPAATVDRAKPNMGVMVDGRIQTDAISVDAESPYQWHAKWDCKAPCTITYSIDPSFPARSAEIIREIYRDISVAPEVEFVERPNGTANVRWHTCESSRDRELAGVCGFWTHIAVAGGQRAFATIKYVETKIDSTSWDQLVDLKSYLCHEALHTLGFKHAPRYLPSCFNGTSPTYQPGQEDFELISIMYPLPQIAGSAESSSLFAFA